MCIRDRYQLDVFYTVDPEAQPLVAGVPVFGNVGSAEYNFWSFEVPEVTDTWLFVELFVNNRDSIVQVELA